MTETNDKKKNGSRLPAKLSLYIRTAVAGYLIYVVYSLRDVREYYEGMELMFFLAAMVFFGVVAVLMGGFSVYALIRGKYEGGAMDPGAEEKDGES